MLQHGYLFIQDRQPGARPGQAPPAQGHPQEPQVRNPILTSSIEMLMGTGGGAANRVEARLANWSDDGLPPVGFSSEAPGLVAGKFLWILACQIALPISTGFYHQRQPHLLAEKNYDYIN